MIRLLPLVLALAACGVDGAPARPADAAPRAPSSNVIVTGSVGMGVSRSF